LHGRSPSDSPSDEERHHADLIKVGVEGIFREFRKILPMGIVVLPNGTHVMIGFPEGRTLLEMITLVGEAAAEEGAVVAAFVSEGACVKPPRDDMTRQELHELAHRHGEIEDHPWSVPVVTMVVESPSGLREGWHWDIRGEDASRHLGPAYEANGAKDYLPLIYG
jgi:hypothetical protein